MDGRENNNASREHRNRANTFRKLGAIGLIEVPFLAGIGLYDFLKDTNLSDGILATGLAATSLVLAKVSFDAARDQENLASSSESELGPMDGDEHQA